MKNLLKAALLALLTLLTCNCQNQVKVSGEVKSVAEGEATITHNIQISVELKQNFLDQCAQELGPDATEAELAACQSAKIANFTEKFLQLITNSQQGNAK